MNKYVKTFFIYEVNSDVEMAYLQYITYIPYTLHMELYYVKTFGILTSGFVSVTVNGQERLGTFIGL